MEEQKKTHTTIRITTGLQKELLALGKKGQSYDDIIRERIGGKRDG